MSDLHVPWLLLAVITPLLGALCAAVVRDPARGRGLSLVFAAATLMWTAGAWLDFTTVTSFSAQDPGRIEHQLLPADVLVIDELSAPLLPLAALLSLLTILATLRTKVRRFSFAATLVSEAILLATFSCRQPWVLVLLLAAGAIPPYVELRRRGRSTRVYLLHLGLFVGLLTAGQTVASLAGAAGRPPLIAVLLTTAAVLLRSGVAPVHCWMIDLFDNASLGTSLLFVTPLVGAYGAMRLVLPAAPPWVLETVAWLSLATAVYAAGMALIQHDARRFFAYLFLSHASLVLIGLEIATPTGLAGALCVWLSAAFSMTGLGLTIRCAEARTGRLSLAEYHGLYDHVPMLAAFFLLTGLSSIGFPGTIGFIGAELLVDAAVHSSPAIGAVVVIATALCGLAVMHAYFRLFTGRRRPATVDLRVRRAEQFAILLLTLPILGGGVAPQPGISSRYHAARALLEARRSALGLAPAEAPPAGDAPVYNPTDAARSSSAPPAP